MKKVKSLKEYALLIRDVSENIKKIKLQIKNKAK